MSNYLFLQIGDLGVSKVIKGQMHFLTTKIGTPLYMSPEQVKQKPYDFKVDIWGIGCCLYQISKFCPPFSGDNLIALGNSIGKNCLIII